MKRTVVATLPVLALTGACLGLGARPAAADVLPLPLPTSLGDVTTLLPTASPLPLPLPTSSPLPLPLPTASPLPLPLPTASPLPLPLPTSSPLPLPLPLPGTTAAPAPGTELLPGTGTTVTRSGGAPVRSTSVGGTTVDQTAPWQDSWTGETPGLQLASASMPAWASALMGSTAFPSVAKDAARPAVLPAPLTVTPSSGSDPAGLPASLVAAAVVSLVVAGGAQVLARAGRL